MKTNFTFYLKSSLMVLFLCLGLSSWGQTYTEDFETQTALTSSYADGSFIGADGVTFTYVHSRDEENFPIDGKGIMLRRTDESSSIEFTLPNGVGNLSFEYRKAFTGGSDRVLAVLVNGVQEYLTPAFGGSSGADATVYTFNENIDEEGSVTIKITYPPGTSNGNRQITIDNISWTAFEDVEPEEVPVVTEDVFFGQVGVPFSETILATENPNSYVITAGSLPSGLTLNPFTGEISGTPTEAGDNFEFTIVASNSVGDSDPANFLIAIEKGEQTVASLDDINAYFGAADITLPIETDQGFTLSYATGDSNVATVSGNILTIVGLGTTELYALAEDVNENYEDYLEIFTITVTEAPETPNVIISQVYEGASNNKWIELTNLGATDADLSQLKVAIWSVSGDSGNGNIIPGEHTSDLTLTGTLSPGATFLIRHSSAANNVPHNPMPTAILGGNVTNFNGNDALALLDSEDNIIDAFGHGINNKDTSYHRKAGVLNPNSSFTLSEWEERTLADIAAADESMTEYIGTHIFGADSAIVWTTDNQWSNATGPTINDDVVIDGDLVVNIVNSFEAKSLIVNGSITIQENGAVTVQGAITNEGNFTIEAGGNLVQNDDVENTGDITVEVKAMTEWFGYNMFSSPVAGQTFTDFSPDNGDEVYTYSFTDDTNHGYVAASGTEFEEGLGYLFAAPYSGFPQGVLTEFTGEFVGVPHNGDVSIPVAYSFTALGNPYPSAIDANDFLVANANVGTLYFWTNAHFYDSVEGAYAGNNYATFTSLTGTGTNGFPMFDNLTIEAGQGFIAAVNAGNVVFNNTMRVGASDGQFYKTMEQEKHILWLNLANENNILNQIAIGYADGATEGVDAQIDGKMFGYAGSALYSIITGEEDAYAIQGRSLPFTNTDAVALGFRAAQAGTYTVSLADFNGLFANGQDIYLKDNATQTYHDLKDGAYTFVSDQGVFESRFEVVYQADGELSTNVPTLDNSWIVYAQDNGLQIEAQGFELKEVSVYDMLGRLIYTNQATGTSHAISNIANGVLIVKVITTDNQVLTRKTAK